MESSKDTSSVAEQLVDRFEQMLALRDRELFRRLEETMGRMTTKAVPLGPVPGLPASPRVTSITWASGDSTAGTVPATSTQTRGTAQSRCASRAAVEMKLRELCEMSKAAESVYNVIPVEMSRVLSPTAAQLASGRMAKGTNGMCGRCSCRELAKSMVGNWIFEGFFMATILGHCTVIGIQIDLVASGSADYSVVRTLESIQHLFALFFAVEMMIRFTAEGCAYFYTSPNLAWNYLDFSLVAVSIVEVFSQFLVAGPNSAASFDTVANMRVIRIIRVTRLLRILRIMRLLRFVRSLRNLVSSIAMTMRSLGWSVMLLVIIIYMFGILITDGVTDYITSEASGEVETLTKEQLRLYFGSVHSAMHTLFRSIANGLSWDVVVRPLVQVGWLWGYVFSLYVVFTLFAVLNVITAVFCQSTIEGAARDKELLAESPLLNKERYYLLVEELFHNLRSQDEDKVTLQNFERRFHDTDVRAFFHGLDLEPSDAWILFSLLDNDGSGDVDSQEFVEGLLKLKGPARAIDLAVLSRDLKTCVKQAQSSQQRLQRLEALLQAQFSQMSIRRAEVEGNERENLLEV